MTLVEPPPAPAAVGVSVLPAGGVPRSGPTVDPAVAAREMAEALRRTNRSLEAQKLQLEITLRSIADSVITLGADGRITSMNPAAERLSGVCEAEALGLRMDALGTLLDAETGALANSTPEVGAGHDALKTFVLVRRDGSRRIFAGTAAPIRPTPDDPTTGTVLVSRDMTREKAAADELAHEASHDPLTGLPNRREFERRADRLGRPGADGADGTDGGRSAGPHVVCYLDLDQFKVVNDRAGHLAADRLLVHVAQLLRDSTRRFDTVARLGGDVFGLLLADCTIDTALPIAEKLLARLAGQRFQVDGAQHALTASVGLARLGDGTGPAGPALADAEIACSAAKEDGRNRVRCFSADDPRLKSRRGQMDWLPRIRAALDEQRFELHLQPIVPVGEPDGPMHHGELLLRFRDEHHALVPPGPLIEAAERFSQMEAIDRWVVATAFAWLATHPGLSASINLSGQSINKQEFLDFVVGRFEETGLDPARVCFEITETAAIADLAAALLFIDALRGRGVRFSLDDFGAGLSSFHYLQNLPVDFVKIDGSFVKAMATDAVSRAIVEAIHRVAKACGLQTIAEWVEDDTTLAALAAIGIDYVQGWRVGRPVPLSDAMFG